MENNFNITSYFLLFKLCGYETSKKSNEGHRKLAMKAFEDEDRVLVTESIDSYVDQMQLILDGVNEQFPDEKPMTLNLTSEYRGVRYITCARGGFQWIVYEVKSKA